METLVHKLKHHYPQFKFIASDKPSWSPRASEIHYTKGHPYSTASLLHELAHAKLRHTKYASDVDLLNKEMDAWEEAQKLAAAYSATIDSDHIQNCLDTYRDWLHKRSTCPTCGANGLQKSAKLYKCINCQQTWHVSNSRFCRPYRLTQTKRTG